MHELEQATQTYAAYAMYIAIAPRDPRDPQDIKSSGSDADHVAYLDPVTLEQLSQALLDRAVPAQVIDGAHIGAPGWMIARTVGLYEGFAPRWAPEENTTRGEIPTISFEDLASGLAQELNAACHVADHPSVPSTHSHLDGITVDINTRAEAVVGRFRSTDGPLLAHAARHDLWFRSGAQWGVVGVDQPGGALENLIGWNSDQPCIHLERNGAWRRLTVAHRDEIGVHEWGPQWTDVDPRTGVAQDLMRYLQLGEVDPAQFVFDFFARPQIDADALAGLFELGTLERDRLHLVLSADNMDDPLTAVTRILGLPEAAAELAEGWREPHHLEGAQYVVAQPFSKAVWAAAMTLPDESDISSRIMRLWLRRPPAYYALNTLEAAALAGLTRYAHKTGRKRTAVVLGALTAVTIADFFTPAKWRGQ
jgi:hypothetical protein